MKERQVNAMLIIKNCNLINMAGIYKEKKDLVVKDGKVLDICDDACQKYGQGNVIIDACGNYVTPGIVEPHCSLGVKEEVFRFEGNDADETTNPIVPQVRAMDAINPRDEGFKMALAGGVTTAVTCPGNANPIGGTCAAIKTTGNTVEEMVMVPEIAIKMCLTDGVKNTYGGKRSPMTRLGTAALIREALMKAKRYHDQWTASQKDPANKPPKFDMKLHSLMRVFDGMPVKFIAKRGHDMMTAVRIAEEFGLTYTVENCVDAWRITKDLKKHNVRCVLGPVYGEKNVERSMVQMTLMVKKGLNPMTALEAVTINAARACGLEDRVGSLEPGKDADIVIWDGDPFNFYTSAATVLIEGNVVYQKQQ